MFHFPTFPPHALCVQAWVTGHVSCRVSPFGNPRIKARLAAPRGLSQPPTSFFGSWCQGIHRVPLLTWPQRCSRPLCSSQITGGSISRPPAPLQEAPSRPVPRGTKWSDRGNGPVAEATGPYAPRKLRSLRTQQRAWAVHQRIPSFQPREVLLNWGALAAGRMVSVPLLSTIHSANGHGMAMDGKHCLPPNAP